MGDSEAVMGASGAVIEANATETHPHPRYSLIGEVILICDGSEEAGRNRDLAGTLTPSSDTSVFGLAFDAATDYASDESAECWVDDDDGDHDHGTEGEGKSKPARKKSREKCGPDGPDGPGGRLNARTSECMHPSRRHLPSASQSLPQSSSRIPPPYDLSGISCPVAVFAGTADTIIDPMGLRKHLPDCSMHLEPGILK